ncbi:peptidylprolyl isomerase [Bacillus pseudomycoides]|uniref:Foldase protein PrsA n=1 Tax=Bacillus pseudomycoides TaxID=64104 RepID=A0AAJ3V3M6_9BACI|nr:peptidylprolyl isomerase PrsA [Bacillus pseudomycoides]MBD5796862.1 peptidylprolyl isomerase [Bacillus pseudomycoides]MDR4325044.1 peptidylprolyl isomerase PrsA [Bacillus pseudomycoides]MED1475354.1 peptidylprolyl isomerase PrsA [Bacillus pseudomycoides]MED1535919.1 peptidylprolyl isomerase PrsA [Bacillus pseudomycoides]PEJ19226.1 peptidylprolyl isomerase [Bacillus pseudomycoides]
MKRKQLWIATAALGTLMLSACGPKDNSEAIATSKVSTITKGDFDKQLKERYGKDMLYEMMAQDIMTKKYKVSDDEVDKEFKKAKDQFGDQFKTVLESNRLKDEDDFKNQIRFKLAMNEAIKKSITDKDVKANYKPEIKASHVLVNDEKTANDIKKQLDEGASFEELAKQQSQDPGSKENGGDLGYFGPGKMVPEFEEAAYKLNVGEISKPIKSSQGYHIIKLTDKKELKPYDEVKDSIRKNLEEKLLADQTTGQKILLDEFKKADIKVKDSDLKDTFSRLSGQQ